MSLIEQNSNVQYLQACVDALRNTNKKLSNQLKGAIILQSEQNHLGDATAVSVLSSCITTIELMLTKQDDKQLRAVHEQLTRLLPPKQKSIHKLNDDKSVFDDFVAKVFVQPLADL
jgi:hypothetical protein